MVDLHTARLAIKADITAKGIAALIAINGGAAIALGTFLGSIVDKPYRVARELLPFVMQGLAWTTFGVTAAAAIFFAQYVQLWIEGKSRRFRHRNPAWWVAWGLAGASLFAFARGMWLMLLDAALVLR